jgi:fructan beta-fructosidase
LTHYKIKICENQRNLRELLISRRSHRLSQIIKGSGMNTKFKNFILLVFCGIILDSCGLGRNDKLPDSKQESCCYEEKYRPQFHFSPEANWMNDPNGLVFLDGEYHLFYQYFPDSTVWGPMHWGHAVSCDLVQWTHLPIALYPDSLGLIFSGSAVVDEGNTAGFGNDGKPAIVAVFTYHNQELEGSGSDRFQSQGIAYSNDKGRTWTKFSGNPVLPNPGKRDFRDPKVFRYDATGKWIMILAVHDRVHIYSSADLKNWSFESEFGYKAGAHGGVWECPDLFPLKVEGSDVTKWVMLVSINPGGPNGGSATQYFTGSFDGNLFVPDVTNEKWLDWGTDNYAGVTWSGIPESDGRRLFIGWMSNWNYATVVPTAKWRSAMTIPRELSLVSINGDFYLKSKPAGELNILRKDTNSMYQKNINYSGEKEIDTDNFRLAQSEIILEFDLAGSNADSLGIILENSEGERFIAGYSIPGKNVYNDRTRSGNSSFSDRFAGIARAPYKAGEKLDMHLFIDASSAEMFIDDGKLVLTSIYFPTGNFSKLRLFSKGGEVILEKAELHELTSIWR